MSAPDRIGLAARLAVATVVLDGGLATALEHAGHDLSDALWSARLLADRPEAIVVAHEAYVRAGAQVLITASYQATVDGFRSVLGREDGAALIASSVGLARWALGGGAERGADVLVAASCGPYGAVLADGSEYTGRYPLGPEDLAAFHHPRLALLAAAGPDVIACETIPCLDEVRALVSVLPEAAAGIETWISCTCGPQGRLRSGEDAGEAAALAAGCPQVVAVGVNCTAPQDVLPALRRMRAAAPALPLVAYPNAGRVWDGHARAWHGDGSDRFPASFVHELLDLGVRLVGGCCGIGPDGIAHVASVLGARPPLRTPG